MKMENQKILKQLFNDYDQASNKATDCLFQSLEARKIGKSGIANYLEKTIYQKLQLNSYQLFIKFSDMVEKL